MPRSSILGLFVEISSNAAQFNKGIKDVQNTLKNFNNNIKSIGSAIGVGFGVKQIASFTFEISKLAGQAEAVTNQFNRLPGSVYIMSELRKATGETVSQFDLMKTAIKASNFNIELSQLPKLLQFATLRAQQTGQSVDYLVESIIMGIGRKSPMILDNLGISLLEIRERLKGVGVEAASVADFTKIIGDIAGESLPNMEKFSENAASKVERLKGAWIDLKIAMGEAANESGILGASIDFLTGLMKILSAESLSFGDKIGVFFDPYPALTYKRILSQVILNQELLANTSKKGTDDATKEFNSLIKVTKDYDVIRRLSNVSLNNQLDIYSEKKKNILKTVEDESEREKKLESILKQKNIYYKDYITTIEKLIEDLKSKEEVDTEKLQKELDAALKVWEKHYKKIEDLQNKIVPPEFTLQKLMKEVGLGPLSKKEAPLLEVKKGENDPFGINKWVDSLKPQMATMDQMRQKSLGLRDTIVSVNNEMKESFAKLAGEGIAMAAEGLGRFLANEKNVKIGREILKSLAEFMKEFGKRLILIGSGEALFAATRARGLKKIAVGAAMVAAGAYTSSKISTKEAKEQEMASIASRNESKSLRSIEGIGNNIEITGTLVGNGRDLIAVINNTNFDNKYRRGG